MNRACPALLVILVAALFAAPLASAEQAPVTSGSSSLHEGLMQANNAFAVQLYDKLASRAGNILFSPYSISAALAMTYAGARGNTAKEIRAALDFRFDRTRLSKAFRSSNRKLIAAVAASGQKLNIADGLCLTRGEVSHNYKTLLKNYYDAEIFSGGLARINGWVKQKTEGKIPRILKQLNPDSVCVILNAIYFKGIWKSRFQKDLTTDAPFTVSSAKQLTVPFMHQQNGFKMLFGNDFRAVSIPYKNDALSMVVLLPNASGGLAGLEKQMTPESLGKWIVELDKQPVRRIDLYLPKFTLKTDYNLKPLLKAMGMNEAFTRKADFSAISGPKGDVWISQIVHKAFVKVNEQGSEAAGASAVEIVTRSMPFHLKFLADHPFVFLIKDNRTGIILFIGRVADPTAG